jgi:thioredoxin 1
MSGESDEEIERINRRKMEEILKSRAQTKEEPTGSPVVLTDADFSSEIGKHELMVVDFWAPWCGPCRMVAPVIEELAKHYKGTVTFGKLNVDENPVTSGAFQVQSIPMILIFKNGKAVDGVLGAVPRSFLESKLAPFLRDRPSSSLYS